MSYGMNGDYQSMAEACGEVEYGSRGWVSGVDFDPYDAEEMEVMQLVWDREKHDHVARVERENAWLQRENERLRDEMEALKPPF
jgi:hypothetical protein